MGRLVLKRKKGQAIVIDGPAVIRVVGSSRGAAKLLVDSTSETRVDREEISEARKRKEGKS